MNLWDIYLDICAHDGNSKPLSTSFYNGYHCYKPLMDIAVLRPVPANVDFYAFITDWFGKDFSKSQPLDEWGLETTVQRDIASDPCYVYLYLIYQHEIRAHRMVFVISTVGLFINLLNWELNCLFLEQLDKKEMSLSQKERFALLDKYLNSLLYSTRIVLEGYAVYRDFMLLMSLYKFQNKPNFIQQAIRLIEESLERKKSYDAQDAYVYQEGFRLASDITDSLGPWGLEIALSIALNPNINKSHPLKFPYPLEVFKEIAQLSRNGIVKNEWSDFKEIEEILTSTFSWSYSVSKSSILDMVKQHYYPLVEVPIPTKDLFIPHDGDYNALPEMVFLFDENSLRGNILTRIEDDRYLECFMNHFLITEIRRRSGKSLWTHDNLDTLSCPLLRSLYATCSDCDFYTNGHGRNLIKRFENSLGKKLCTFNKA